MADGAIATAGENTSSCKYWRFGFCSRGEKCMFVHNPEEFAVDRDPNLPQDVTPQERNSGHHRGKKRTRQDMGQAGGYGGGLGAMAQANGAPMGMRRSSVMVMVHNVPIDATYREVAHIFRQYVGFQSCDLQPQGQFAQQCMVEMVDQVHADYLAVSLTNYQFDELDPSSCLKLSVVNSGGKKGAKGKGKGKGKSKGKGKAAFPM